MGMILVISEHAHEKFKYVDARNNRAMKIIIVDDDKQIVKMLEIYFTKMGHEVVGKAYDGNSAMGMIENIEFDAMVIDYGLPDMNGYEIATYAKKIRKNSKILIITAHDDIAVEEFPVIKKPFKSLKSLLISLGS